MVSAFVGAGIAVCGAVTSIGTGYAAAPTQGASKLLPTAKPRLRPIELAAKSNPCNPCAAKKACNPCNPGAAKKGHNPCNPCGASGVGVSAKCVVPRLAAAWKSSPCNPCSPCYAAKKGCNPCNPCAAKKACNPCNPCAAKKKAANPCAAKNPCNPCGAGNPCNPCGGAPVAEISAAEAGTLYSCLKGEMAKAYGKAGLRQISGYQSWLNIAAAPYQSATHGNRYVNNYADGHGDYRYKKFEKAGKMPQGSVLAKDSFVVGPDGKAAIGPMFIMEKMAAGFKKSTGDWKYSMIMPNGKVAGTTGGKGMSMKFCAECHASVAPEQDYIMLLPDEARKKF